MDLNAGDRNCFLSKPPHKTQLHICMQGANLVNRRGHSKGAGHWHRKRSALHHQHATRRTRASAHNCQHYSLCVLFFFFFFFLKTKKSSKSKFLQHDEGGIPVVDNSKFRAGEDEGKDFGGRESKSEKRKRHLSKIL